MLISNSKILSKTTPNLDIWTVTLMFNKYLRDYINPNSNILTMLCSEIWKVATSLNITLFRKLSASVSSRMSKSKLISWLQNIKKLKVMIYESVLFNQNFGLEHPILKQILEDFLHFVKSFLIYFPPFHYWRTAYEDIFWGNKLICFFQLFVSSTHVIFMSRLFKKHTPILTLH